MLEFDSAHTECLEVYKLGVAHTGSHTPYSYCLKLTPLYNSWQIFLQVDCIVNQIRSNGLLGIAAPMLDYNNIEVMRLRLITLRVVSVDNTIAATKITSIYTKIQKHGFKTTENKF